MARRLNYTGRKKINRADISIRVHTDFTGASFDAELSKLVKYNLDPQARVYVEAYRSASTAWDRWDFGRVGLLSQPSAEQRSLDKFGGVDGLLFRVKVSGDGDTLGRLLAEADAIRPVLPDDPDGHGSPLIKPEPGAIGHEPWRLRFDDDMPVLVINDKTPQWKDLVGDLRFRAVVAPAAMRQILTQILVIDRGQTISDDDETKWSNRWIRFAESLPKVQPCDGSVDDDNPVENVMSWIDTAVSAFSERSGLFNRFLEIRAQEISQ